MVLLYHMGLAGGPRESFESRAFGNEMQESGYDNYLSLCNLFFVIVFRLIVLFLPDQWPMSTGQGDNAKVRFWRRANKCAADENDKAVLITGIVKWNPLPMSLNNKGSIKTLYSTGMLVRVNEKNLKLW